jgi:hypothetical protein
MTSRSGEPGPAAARRTPGAAAGRGPDAGGARPGRAGGAGAEAAGGRGWPGPDLGGARPGLGTAPAGPRVVRRDPDPDGVALAAAVTLGVAAGGAVAWLGRPPVGPVLLGGVAGLAVVLLVGGRRLARRRPMLAGVLVLAALAGARCRKSAR